MKQFIEENKIIAEFIGWKHNVETRGSFKFHSSWDWLMPVVEKINGMAFDNVGEVGFIIYPNRCDLINSSDEIIIEGFSKPTTIEAVWLAVIEFIKWYNKEQNVK